MGFSVDFTDNKSISAETLNAILAEVGDDSVSASSEFTPGSLFYTDKFNCIRSEIVSGGIRCGCEAAICDTGVIIGEGVCFFDSGMRMEIDAEGITLVISKGTENYVYLYASPTLNTATAVVTAEEKEGSEYVPVCHIDADGNIYDERVWCRAKIPMMNSRFVQNEKITVENIKLGGKALVASFPMANKAYSYIFFTGENTMAMYFRDTNKYTYFVTDDSGRIQKDAGADYFRAGYYQSSANPYNAQLTVEEENSCLNLYAEGIQAYVEIEMLVI